jgi:hypothetical protein
MQVLQAVKNSLSKTWNPRNEYKGKDYCLSEI